MDEDDLRSDLEAAFEEQEEEISGEPEEAGGSEEDTEEPLGAEEAEGGEPEAEAEDQSDDPEPDEEEEGEAENDEPDDDTPAPTSWNAQAREHWDNLPKNLKEYVHERERQFATAIQRNTESAKFGDHVSHVLRPFEAVMQMEGADPIQAIHGMALTASTLRMGTPSQKAQMIAKMVNDYGVDIQHLDSALVGEEIATPEETRMMQMVQQQLQPMQQFMQNYQQNQQMQGSSVDSEIQEFQNDSNNEFFSDLRELMGDIIEMNSKRGKSLTLQESYDIACKMDPTVSNILENRQAQTSVMSAAKKTAAKKKAASSVRSGSPRTRAPKESDEQSSLRSDLEAAWEDYAT